MRDQVYVRLIRFQLLGNQLLPIKDQNMRPSPRRAAHHRNQSSRKHHHRNKSSRKHHPARKHFLQAVKKMTPATYTRIATRMVAATIAAVIATCNFPEDVYACDWTEFNFPVPKHFVSRFREAHALAALFHLDAELAAKFPWRSERSEASHLNKHVEFARRPRTR